MTISKQKILEYVAEFLGTFMFVNVLILAPLLARGYEAFIIGATVAVLVFVFGGLSKAHFNPAVTFGEFMVSLFRSIRDRKFKMASLMDLVGYWVVQMLAALAVIPGILVIKNMLIDYLIVKNSLDATLKDQFVQQVMIFSNFTDGFAMFALLMETLGTFMLVFIILRVTSSERLKNYTAALVGLTFFVIIYLAGDISGASFNPARSLAPAIFSGTLALSQVWVYIVGPFVGALLAALVHSGLKMLEAHSARKAAAM